MNKSKFLLLVKIELLSFFGINKALHSKSGRDRRRLALMAVAGVLISGYFVAASYIYSVGIAELVELTGGPMSSVPMTMLCGAFVFTMFAGIYQGGGILFKNKDYDLTMSLPVSVSTIAASRLFTLYLYELLISALLIIPSLVVFALHSSPGIMFYVLCLPCVLASPLIPLVISSFLSALTMVISSRAKRLGTLVNILLMLLIVGGTMYLSFSLSNDSSLMEINFDKISAGMGGYYPPALWFVKGVCGESILYSLLFVAVSAAAFVLFCRFIAVRYREICTRLASTGSMRRYKNSDIKATSRLMALYKREIGRYFSSAIYVTNTIVGMFLGILGSAALLVSGGIPGIPEEIMDQAGGAFMQIIPIILSMLVCMSNTTGSSISIEGKQIWILKSLPAGAWEIFLAKILLNLTITVPGSLICSLLLSLAFKAEGFVLLCLFLMPLIYAVFGAVVGLVVNLALPKLDWRNEAQVVKQSASSMISILGIMIIPLTILFVSLAFGENGIYLACLLSLVPLVATCVCVFYLRRHGERRFLNIDA